VRCYQRPSWEEAEDEEQAEEAAAGEEAAGAEAGTAGGKVGGKSARSVARKRAKMKTVSVTLDLGLSAHANARDHFAAKKKHAVKHDKTVAQNQRAVGPGRKCTQHHAGGVTRVASGGIRRVVFNLRS